MIVSCEHCQTRFRLDDSKVPESGARVRCSKCNYAFYIPPPGASDDLMAAEQAREVQRELRSREPEDSDSDWEFNHEPQPGAPPGQGLDAARQAVDGLLGALGGDTDDALAGAEPEPEGAPGPGSEPDAAEPAPAVEPPPEPQRQPEPEPPPQPDLPPQPEAPIEAEPDRSVFEAPAAPAAGAAAELGGPEGWDLLDDDDPDPAPAARPTPARWKVPQQDRAEVAAADNEPSPLGRALRGTVGTVGWLVTLALFVAGGWGALQPREVASAALAGKLEAPGFRALEVRGRWIENAVAGRIFVVSGSLRRADASGAAATGALLVRLLDARGEPLPAAPTPVGPPFGERALRESDPSELQASQRRAAAEFSRLHPGETVAFQAVFSRVPPEAARFDLERGGGS